VDKVIKSSGIIIRLDYPKRMGAGEEFMVRAEMLNGVKKCQNGWIDTLFPSV